jgi:hypothetical protein
MLQPDERAEILPLFFSMLCHRYMYIKLPPPKMESTRRHNLCVLFTDSPLLYCSVPVLFTLFFLFCKVILCSKQIHFLSVLTSQKRTRSRITEKHTGSCRHHFTIFSQSVLAVPASGPIGSAAPQKSAPNQKQHRL